MKMMARGTDAVSPERQVWAIRGHEEVFAEEDGSRLTLPAGWCFVPSGDAGLTRRLKASGEHWVVVHRRRGRIESVGVCVPESVVVRERSTLEAERGSEAYRHRLEQSHRRRDERQVRYAESFYEAVRSFLGFAPRWGELAERLAHAVTDHAVPIGSGTVARTETIPLAVRAEAAVIAWMRHQTTCYDDMTIARVRGARRAVRRQLAERSREVLQRYRDGLEIDVSRCPLWNGLARWEEGHGRTVSAEGERKTGAALGGSGERGKELNREGEVAGKRKIAVMNGHLKDFFAE